MVQYKTSYICGPHIKTNKTTKSPQDSNGPRQKQAGSSKRTPIMMPKHISALLKKGIRVLISDHDVQSDNFTIFTD